MFSSRPRLLLVPVALAFVVACSGLTGDAIEREPVTASSVPEDTPGDDPVAFGKAVYLAACAACHQADGRGVHGLFPSLAGSDVLQGNRREVMAIALFGIWSSDSPNRASNDSAMPSLGHLTDRELAAALSYVFDSWGNDLEPVSEAEVAALRAELGQTDRAAGQRHPGATEGELTHLGRPSPIPIQGIRPAAGADRSGLSSVEFRTAVKLYFERCASCHGATRSGSIGKPLTPGSRAVRNADYLRAMIMFGSPAGMPNWGSSGEMSDFEIDLLVDFLQQPPPSPPGFGTDDIRDSWDVLVAPEDRPAEPQHSSSIENFFVVALQGPGGIGIIDGDSKEMVAVIETDAPVEQLRVSTTGRYVVWITRRARVDMIDLYMDPPARVATVKAGHEARAVAIASYAGHEDSVVAAGAYWPPQLVLMDGATLEPLELISTRDVSGDATHPEPRVAAIAASRTHPEFLVTIKETGEVLFVSYADPGNPLIEPVATFRLLDEGGWERSARYLLTAADLSNKVAVIDSQERALVAVSEVTRTPGPGRGVNLEDPDFGPVRVTSAVGNSNVTFLGADPEGHADVAWQPVRILQGMGGGSLYARSHSRSSNLWVDAPLNPDPSISQRIAVFDLADLDAGFETLPVAEWAGLGAGPNRVMQPEYNRAGDEVWFSVWNRDGERAAIVVVDDETRTLKTVIKNEFLIAPTRKFNIYNTLNEAH